MPTLYRYKARDKEGKLLTGVVRGENEGVVERYLESLEISPVAITPRTDFSPRRLVGMQAKPNLEDLILVTRKLSTLYRAGIPILKSLEMVSEQYEETRLGQAILEVRDNLERGESMSDAMAKHPRIFGPIYTSSIKAAEASGKLDVVLDQLAEALERELVTREEVKKALRYPVMVIVAIVAAFLVLTTFVIPKFAQFYGDYGSELPLPTRVLMAISQAMAHNWYYVFPALVIGAILLVKSLRQEQMRPRVDAALLRLPVIGNLLVKTSLARFAHLSSVLIASGTPLIACFDIVKEAVGNASIGKEVGELATALREGRSLLDCRHHLRHFPSMAISLMHVGLESGKLELTLAEISRFFDREVRYTSSRLTSLLEPLLILCIGGMVIFLALAVFLPMWNLISVFRS